MKLKTCGLVRPLDIEYANEIMPDFVGFVFAYSKRQVSMETARELRSMLDAAIPAVGVFVDAEIDDILTLREAGIIQLAQLHGHENEAYISELQIGSDMPIIKAVQVESVDDIICAEQTTADYLLFDNGSGGTGKMFDWSVLKEARDKNIIRKPFFVAGGVNSQNLKEVAALKPYGVDVSTGIETDGKKDKNKMLEVSRLCRKGAAEWGE